MRAVSVFALVVLLLGGLIFGYILLPGSGGDSCQGYQVNVSTDIPADYPQERNDYADLPLDQQQVFLLAKGAETNSTRVHESPFDGSHAISYESQTYYVTQQEVTLDPSECPSDGGLSLGRMLLIGTLLLLVVGGVVLGRDYYHRL